MQNAGINPVLIEVNRRRPALQRLFGLDPKRSLAAILTEGRPALDQVQRDSTGLAMIPAGAAEQKMPAVMSLESALCHAVQELQNSFDYILLDAPPILESVDVLVAGRIIPHVLLVVGAGQVSGENLARACQQLQDAKISLAGTILNSRKRFIPGWVERLLPN
jgi:Mrp family chromosome partitioning ATPase